MRKYKRPKQNFSEFDPNDFISYGLNTFILQCDQKLFDIAKHEILENFHVDDRLVVKTFHSTNSFLEQYLFVKDKNDVNITSCCVNWFYYGTGILFNDKHRHNASGYRTLMPNHIKWLWTGFLT